MLVNELFILYSATLLNLDASNLYVDSMKFTMKKIVLFFSNPYSFWILWFYCPGVGPPVQW